MTVPSSAARWLGRTQPERFEMMTRWSIYFVFALPPFLALTLITGGTPYTNDWVLAYPGAVAVQAILAARVFVPAMRVYNNRAVWPVGRMWWLAAATLVCGAIALQVYPGRTEALGVGLLIPLAIAVMAISPIPARVRTLLALAIGTGVIAALVQLAIGTAPVRVVPTLIIATFSITAVAASCRMSGWMMAVVWQLDEARAVAGRLAVAEERLRFSRDLHDVFGRTLSTVAVKSELAAALAERGDPRGSAEMLEVRQLAHDALREVRGVIQGYRSADLDTEIAGARALLRSAGVECRVAGEGLTLPEGSAEAVAWVVREAVTNVVRHAAATRCDIDIRVQADRCLVRIENDGAPAIADPIGSGNGLRGLRERLSARGGTFGVVARDGVFTVTAEVPLGLRKDEAP
ncbi:sensor histidine kinase [Pseudactinotalea suaedae]|uniref:sensor histidine kinase n=1 Tax=Pseudactinotalea suaedae TaxID=1524924 RepID=UPI0012E22DAD|nr:sensor histidine kinase [Pseudactinotalea suaedae]